MCLLGCEIYIYVLYHVVFFFFGIENISYFNLSGKRSDLLKFLIPDLSYSPEKDISGYEMKLIWNEISNPHRE